MYYREEVGGKRTKRVQNWMKGAWALSVETLFKNKFIMLSDSAEGQDFSALF